MKLPEQLQFIQNARLPQRSTTTRLDGRCCVVTGATSGVGYYGAKRLAAAGADLVLICRNPRKAAAVAEELRSEYGAAVRAVIADFSRLEEVRAAARTILSDGGPVDVLVNNIGIHNTVRRLTEDGLEEVFCVNHLASFLLTRLLLPRLRESARPRIIQVNSQGHRFGGLDLTDLSWARRRYRGLSAYGAAKTAQLLTVWELADRLADSGVTINAMHPGAVKSNIGMNNGPLYRFYSRAIINRLLKDPAIAGDALYFLVAAPEMEGVTGRYFNLTIDEVPAAHARDREVGTRIWDLSETLVGLRGEGMQSDG